MVDVAKKDLKTVKAILKRYVSGAEVRAFGSRVAGGAKPYSDFDLAILGDGKISLAVLAQIKEAFQESDLSFRVDVVDWNGISPEFQKVIAQKYVVI